MARSVTEVIHDHLERRLCGDIEGDLRENYHDEVVILSGFGTYRGHDGVRQSADLLSQAVAGGAFTYNRTVIEGSYGFLEWTAADAETVVLDGADSFHVRDGKIVEQTIHYTAWPRD